MENIFHFYDKQTKKSRFYGSLAALFELERTGIVLSRAYAYDWKKPLDNFLCTITKNKLIRSTEARKLTNLKKLKEQRSKSEFPIMAQKE